jgi:UPF0271 protein
MGEGMPNDALLMPFITSANIACGAHAGDMATMRATVQLALQHGVAIGAHPGFADKENFGRKEMQLPSGKIYTLVQEQIFLLKKIAEAEGAALHHVKPHGALYNMAAKDAVLAGVIARAIKDADASLIVYGLSGSCMISAAAQLGLRTCSEVFADRSYQPDGSLTPRSQRGALIESEDAALQQVMQMVQEQRVTTSNGTAISIKAETICIHGDGPHAVAFAQKIYHHLFQ